MVASESIWIRVLPEEVHSFDKILESFDNLALVTVESGKKGEIKIIVTQGRKLELLEVLSSMGKAFEVLKEERVN